MLSLRLTQQQVQEIVEQAKTGLPHEICGLISGDKGIAQRIIPIPNQSTTPKTHFDMDASALLQAHKAIDAAGQTLVAVYHSHPNSDPLPSQTDIRESMRNMPNVIHLIVSLKHQNPRLQAWYFHDERVEKAEVLVGNMRSQHIKPLSRAQIIAIILAATVAVILLLMISFSLLPPAPSIPTPQ